MVLIQGNWVLEISFVQRQQQQRQQQSLGTARSLTEPSLTKRFFLLSFVTSSTLPNQCYFANKHTNAIAWLPSSKSLSIWEQTQFLAFLTVVSPNCPFFCTNPSVSITIAHFGYFYQFISRVIERLFEAWKSYLILSLSSTNVFRKQASVTTVQGVSERSAMGTAHSWSEEEKVAFTDWINDALGKDPDLSMLLPEFDLFLSEEI